MALRDSLVKKPRETSGSSSGNRFDYQRDWALCHLFDLHEGGSEYVLVMEHHDDVVVLDAPAAPTKADCYQVKTKDSGRWSLADLLRQKANKGGKAPSILGKMYDNCSVFQGDTRSVNFVSNAPYNVTLSCGDASDTREKICLNELDAGGVTEVNSQIRQEHGLAQNPVFVDLAYLRWTSLSLSDHVNHATGRLVRFLEKVRPNAAIAVGTLYRTLYGEMRRCANYEKKGLDYDGILVNKAITRAQFDKMIAEVPEAKNFEAIWATINAQLTSEDVGLPAILELRRECQRYEMERMNRSNAVLAAVRTAAEQEMERVKAAGTEQTLKGMLVQCAAGVATRKVQGAAIYTATYIKAIGLLHCYGY